MGRREGGRPETACSWECFSGSGGFRGPRGLPAASSPTAARRGGHPAPGQAVKASRTLTNGSLDLAQNLVVGNGPATLVVRNDLRLLVDFLERMCVCPSAPGGGGRRTQPGEGLRLRTAVCGPRARADAARQVPADSCGPSEVSGLPGPAPARPAAAGGRALTVARSFCVSPLLCRPCWMTLPTSRVTRSWCSSSVSRSSLAVFLVIECCLFWPAAPGPCKARAKEKVCNNPTGELVRNGTWPHRRPEPRRQARPGHPKWGHPHRSRSPEPRTSSQRQEVGGRTPPDSCQPPLLQQDPHRPQLYNHPNDQGT